MKNFKMLCIKICILLGAVTFTQCATGQKMDKNSDLQIKDAFFQEIPSGIANGPITLFVSFKIEETATIQLTHAFFRGKKIALKKSKTSEHTYEGQYTYPEKLHDLIMSGDPKKEFGNQVPKIEEPIPFELTGNECMLQYIDDGKEKVFKINTLKEKALKNIPM
ncbi:hypothetical protein J8281_14075 [Aquimarina sp. U1-2]|uniref:hypothetical protein n=1 Tax=Aquimarina sp. U1-2 TaxID=2823141 RepID=UPI001AECEBFB|nr:hypothetical protein [Aquimarina sp. U1-2]MBP2833318.1 hypothetical protein [Aquimarina sp. U1-2]